MKPISWLSYKMDIKNNIILFNREVSAAGARLIAVGKTHPTPQLLEAYEAGQRLFGENKVQEMAAKQEVLPNDIGWHMIGHLQTNKVKLLAPWVALIHSVDSVKLMEEIHKQGKKIGRIIPCLLQVHIAREETKFGFSEAELISLAENSSEFDSVEIQGLMGMATLTEDAEKIRGEFRELKSLFQKLQSRKLPANLKMKELSMGMSSDYKIALEEGSTLVRIGTAIFGERTLGRGA
jgi:pyridoxal phosphate enzyme (YggS family)